MNHINQGNVIHNSPTAYKTTHHPTLPSIQNTGKEYAGIMSDSRINYITLNRCGHTTPPDIPQGPMSWNYSPVQCSNCISTQAKKFLPDQLPRPANFPKWPQYGNSCPLTPRITTPEMKTRTKFLPSIFPMHNNRPASVYTWTRGYRDSLDLPEFLHTPEQQERIFVMPDLSKAMPRLPGLSSRYKIHMAEHEWDECDDYGWVECIWNYGFYVLAALCWFAWVSGAHELRIWETWKVEPIVGAAYVS